MHRCTGARYGKTSKRGRRRSEGIGLMHAQGETISVGVDSGSIETDRITFEFTAPGYQGHRPRFSTTAGTLSTC